MKDGPAQIVLNARQVPDVITDSAKIIQTPAFVYQAGKVISVTSLLASKP